MIRHRHRITPFFRIVELDRRDLPSTVWTGAGGNALWSNPANWNTGILPTPGDDVIITSPSAVTLDPSVGLVNLNSLMCDSIFNIAGGTLNVFGSATFNKLVMQSAGTLTGPGQFNFNARVDTTGGSMTGTGVTAINGTSLWNISTTSGMIALTGRTIEDRGTVNWSGSGNLLTADGAFNVRAGASFNISAGAVWQYFMSGGVAGTPINVDPGAAMSVNSSIQFQGAVNVAGNFAINGPIALQAGGAWSGSANGSGGVNVNGGTLNLTGNASVTTVGAVQIAGGGSLFLDTSANVFVSNLGLAGAGFNNSGKLTIGTAWTWSAGVIGGNGTTTINSSAVGQIDTGSMPLQMNNQQFGNAGAIKWIGNNSLSSTSSSWSNSGSFEIAGNGTWNATNTATPTIFVNQSAGTLQRSTSPGTATIQFLVRNFGTIKVDTGTLVLNGGLEGAAIDSLGSLILAGTLRVPNLDVTNNPFDLTISGNGGQLVTGTIPIQSTDKIAVNARKLTISNNTQYNSADNFTNKGTVDVHKGSTFNITGDYTQTSGTTIQNGTLHPTGKFYLSGGTLKGTGFLQGSLVHQAGATLSPGNSPGLYRIGGDYTQSGTLSMELNGLIAGSEYDQLQVGGTVTLGGPLAIVRGFNPVIGNSFKLIDNIGTGTVVGTFSGLSEGATFNGDGMRFKVTYTGGDGNDVVLTRVPAVVASVTNGDGVQFSTVRSLTVVFGQVVTLPATAANAFKLTRYVGGAAVGDVSVLVDTSGSTSTQTTAKLTFLAGPNTEVADILNPNNPLRPPSLADGKYKLTLFGGIIVDTGGEAIDGDGDGSAGGDYVTGDGKVQRIFGDIDVDGDVDAADFIQFRLAFGGTNSGFDIDADGSVSLTDFIRFRSAFGNSL